MISGLAGNLFNQSRRAAAKPPGKGKKMAYIYIENLYGINDGRKAYYRKQGVYCFDFVNSKEYASDLTKEEAEAIMSYADWYKNQYKASVMGIEQAETA